MNKKVIIIVALILVISVATVYSFVSRNDLEGTVKVSGAWALYPMMVKWAEEFQKTHPKVRIDVSAGGAGKGMADALGGLVDIGMVSREIYPEEVEQGALGIAVVMDAVAPTLSEDNPVLNDLLVKGIKRQTFVDVWINGNITTWGEVAGRPEITTEINVYTRSDACGAAETWANYLGRRQENLLGVGVYGDPGLAEAVRKDPFGIGFNNLNYAYDNSTGKPIDGLTLAPIDLNSNGQVDENEDFYDTKAGFLDAVASGAYPSPPARDLYVVAKDEFKGLAKDFVQWILTDGQQYVSETGYVGLTSEKLQEGLTKLG